MAASSVLGNSGHPLLRELSPRDFLPIVAAALLVTGVVYYFAWLSDDCFITLRYVANTLHGYGPVFNVGEHVQGYSHPLWFVLLLIGSLVVPNPMFVSYGYCFLFTFLTVFFVGWALMRVSSRFLTGALLLGAAGVVWLLSDPWISFQTSGLEGSLAHLLIVAIVWEAWIRAASRPGRLWLLMGLLCLTRPDFVIWSAPLMLLLLARVRSLKQFALLTLASLPVLAWLLFALIYYHDILPNTFHAKVGNYPTLGDSISAGLNYLGDWFHYDPVAAGGTVLFLTLAAWQARTPPRIALLAASLLYLGWIILVGGDFMRGRLFMPIFTAAIFTGSLAVAELSALPRSTFRLQFVGIAALFAALVLFKFISGEPAIEHSNLGIVNERKYYPGYALSNYLQHGRLDNPYEDLQLADVFRQYAEKCGPLTIHLRTPGSMGYFAGPQVSIIDFLGLTDAFIAKLPKSFLIQKIPRPGHPYKYIPVTYLVSRQDVALFPHWLDSIKAGECGLTSQLDSFKPIEEHAVLQP